MPNMKKTLGELLISYLPGKENRRGFFLRDGGYYWAIIDFSDMAIRGNDSLKDQFYATVSVASHYKKSMATMAI